MATLTGEQLKNSYQSLVTIGDSITSDPTSGRLENGKGTALTAVGIGTDSPSTTLHLDVTSGDNIISAVADAGNSAIFLSSAGSGKDNRFVIGNGKDLFFETTATSTPSATGTERMRIAGGGDISFRDTSNNEAFYWDASEARLGLGTTSPDAKLEIESSGSSDSVVTIDANDARGAGRYALNISDSDPNSRGSVRISTTSGPSLTTTGNVGIGTTDIEETLSIAKTDGGDGTIVGVRSDSSFSQFEIVTKNSQTDWGLQTIGSRNMYFTTNGQERMRIDSSGNVGIGTDSPSALLDVDGDASINGVTVGRGLAGVSSNTAVGANALSSNTTGTNNTAVGQNALEDNTTGTNNTAVGAEVLLNNTTGDANTAVGRIALRDNTTGNDNTAVGREALLDNTTGDFNTAVGLSALRDNETGSGNIGFAFRTDAGSYAPVFNPTTEDNRLVAGHTAITNAYVQVAWTVVSDARDKTNIEDVELGLDFVSKLSPKQFQFKKSREDETPNGKKRYGFLAQDILELEGDNPVIIDNEDEDKLKYNGESLVPILVNAIKELKAEIEQLKAQ